MANFKNEKEGQIKFFEQYGIWNGNYYDDENSVRLINNTDGIYKGVIFEFKIQINNYNNVLWQAIKYLSIQRIKGNNIPKNILLVSLNQEKAFLFNSFDFLKEIEQWYIGSASKNNNSFLFEKDIEPKVIDNIFKRDGIKKIEKILDDFNFTKINIDQLCVVGWAERYYKEKENATKTMFFNELRNPKKFKRFLNPWKGKEDDFKYIMDLLNDPNNKIKLGAFYTPKEYAEYSYKMIKKAIKQIPQDNDYVIIDRCAGTGNLEELFTDEELSHTIVSTYELWEWIVLNKRIGPKVKLIIPPKPDHKNGLLKGGDAMAQAVFQECKKYIEDPKCTIILIENPPYRDETSNLRKKGIAQAKETFIRKKMKEKINNGRIANELSSQFIWSAFEYYLIKKGDSLILYSPIKYWKSQHIINKKFMEGYLLNRKFFHASESAISLIWWKNEKKIKSINELKLKPIMLISNKNNLVAIKEKKEIKIKKVFNNLNYYFDIQRQKNEKDNYIAMLSISGYNLDNASGRLLRKIEDLKGHGTKKLLYKDNFYKKIPLFVSKKFIYENWTQKEVLYTTSDGKENYLKDEIFLRQCSFWVAMSKKNECISYYDKNKNNIYQNELTFSNLNFQGKKINKYITSMDEYFNNYIFLKEDEIKILKQFFKIHSILKEDQFQKKINSLANKIKIKPFDKNLVYGIYQINKNFNLSYKLDEKGIKIFKEDNPNKFKKLKTKKFKINYKLNTNLEKLNIMMNQYYNNNLKNKLFYYELLK